MNCIVPSQNRLAVVICPFGYLRPPAGVANLQGVSIAGGLFVRMLEDPERGGWQILRVDSYQDFKAFRRTLAKNLRGKQISEILLWCSTHAWDDNGELMFALRDTGWKKKKAEFDSRSAASLSKMCEAIIEGSFLSRPAKILVVTDCCNGQVAKTIGERLHAQHFTSQQVAVGAIVRPQKKAAADKLLLLDVLQCAAINSRDVLTVLDLLPAIPNDDLDFTEYVAQGCLNDFVICRNPKRKGVALPIADLMKAIGQPCETTNVLAGGVLKASSPWSADLKLWDIRVIGPLAQDGGLPFSAGLGRMRVLTYAVGDEDRFPLVNSVIEADKHVLYRQLADLAAVSSLFHWNRLVAIAHSVSDQARLAAKKDGFILTSWMDLSTEAWAEHRSSGDGLPFGSLRPILDQHQIVVDVPRGIARDAESPVRQLFEAWTAPTRFRASFNDLARDLKHGIVRVRFDDLARLAPLPTRSNLHQVILELNRLAPDGGVELIVPYSLFRDRDDAAEFLTQGGPLKYLYYSRRSLCEHAFLTIFEIFPGGNPFSGCSGGAADWALCQAVVDETLAKIKDALPPWLNSWARATERKEVSDAVTRLCAMAAGRGDPCVLSDFAHAIDT